ncbi:MAG: hypothetical protein P8N60_03390 [Burkholderiaceae bacterium]|nr:hypothetical protein [Burkholderiaceae bacterium]
MTVLLQPLLLVISFLAGAGFAVGACAQEVDEQEVQYATPEEERLILNGNILYPAKKLRPKKRIREMLTRSSYSSEDTADIARALEILGLTVKKAIQSEAVATTLVDPTPDLEAHAKSSADLKQSISFCDQTSCEAKLATEGLSAERQTETVASKSILRQEAIASTPKTNLDYSLASVGGKPEVGPMASLLEQDLGVAARKVASQTWDYRVRIKRKSIVVRVTY